MAKGKRFERKKEPVGTAAAADEEFTLVNLEQPPRPGTKQIQIQSPEQQALVSAKRSQTPSRLSSSSDARTGAGEQAQTQAFMLQKQRSEEESKTLIRQPRED